MAVFSMIGKLLTAIKSVKQIAVLAVDALSAMQKAFEGKTIAIIGPTGAGKNSMYDRLRNQEPPKKHVQTRGAEKVENFPLRYTLPESNTHINFKCKRCINVGGEIDQRERYWLQASEGAHLIFYLIDAERLRDSKDVTMERLREDLEWIVLNVHAFHPDFVLHFLLNKVDVVTKGLSTEQAVARVKAEFGTTIEELEEIVKNTLDPYAGRVSGLSPISMTDPILFRRYFATALSQIRPRFV